ncbi:MAG: hypothetical protein GY874_07350 [Desulfobacteraceae bacterium]|nr:hypothetical protein [Desulfobacteraceae bacterium]
MMKQKNNYLKKVIVIAVLLFAIVSCGKVNVENFGKIENGMTYDQVKGILGDPTNCESMPGAKRCVWQSGEKKIEIKFLTDKVVFVTSENL